MNKHILIIGGGIAGMSAGIYAQKNGYTATILEMHDKPGGQLTSWVRNGYRFDYCLHWLAGSDHGVYRNIWEEIGAINEQTEIINHPDFVRMVDETHGEFYIYNNLNDWETYLIQFAPGDEKAISKLCRMMRKADNMDQFESAPGLRKISDYFRFFVETGSFIPIILRYFKSTTDELIQHLGFKDPKLLHFLGLLFGGRDFSALGFLMMMGWAHAKNAGYLKGGSYPMAQRIAQKFRELGGTFRFNARVKKINVEGNQAKSVTLENGETLNADYVIGACDGHTILYDMLQGEYLPEKVQQAYENWDLFQPLVMIGVGVADTIDSTCHNERFILAEKRKIGQTLVEGYSIMNRSLYDPSFSLPSKTTLLLQFESPWEIWESLQGVAYLNEKEAIRKAAVDILEHHYPGITDKIETIDIATPQTTVRFTGVWKGAYEGFMPSHDVLNGLPMELEGLENFLMIGQWLFPGGGLPPSAQSGKWAIQKLVNQEKKTFVTA